MSSGTTRFVGTGTTSPESDCMPRAAKSEGASIADPWLYLPRYFAKVAYWIAASVKVAVPAPAI